MSQDRPLKRKQIKDLEKQKKTDDLKSTRHLIRVNKNRLHSAPWINLKHDSPISPLNQIGKDSKNTRVPPEVEAYCGDLARIILGIHQPKYRAVDDGSVMTKEIKGFKTIATLSLDELNELAAKATQNGLIAALVLTFYLSDPDGNSGNFGVNTHFKVTRIDFEGALNAYRQEVRYKEKKMPAWAKSWAITADNVNHLLLELGLNAFGGYDIQSKGFKWEREFNKESKQDHASYDREKFKYLLKIILIDRPILNALAKDHLSEENLLLVDHLESRRQTLENTLSAMENFQAALAANQETYWNELKAEFNLYNKEQEQHIQKLQYYMMAIEQKNTEQLASINNNPKYAGKSLPELKNIFNQKITEYRGRLINMDELKLRYEKIIENKAKAKLSFR